MSKIVCNIFNQDFLENVYISQQFVPHFYEKMRFSVILAKKNPIKLHFSAKIQLSCNHIFQLIEKSNSETYNTNPSQLLGGNEAKCIFLSKYWTQVFTLCPIFEKIGLFCFRRQSWTLNIRTNEQNRVKYGIVDLTKNYIYVERISNLESPYIRSWHILWGTIRAHMRCVGQTDPQIQ